MKVLKKHFDAAVKQRWSPETCILAQCALSNGTELYKEDAEYSDPIFASRRARKIMLVFDSDFKKPGDETLRSLQALRKSLPIDIK